MTRATSWMTVAVLVTVLALPAEAAAQAPAAVAAAACAKETKRLKAFQRGMKAAKRRYFRAHRSPKTRKRFVQKQRKQLAALRRARARCLAKRAPVRRPAPPVPAALPLAPPAVGPPLPAPAASPAPAPRAALAVDAIVDVVSDRAQFAPGDVTVENGVEIVRTQLELVLAADATVDQMNALLARLGAEVVSSLAGVGLLTVRIPDPGSLDALRAIVAGLAGAPGLVRADLVAVPPTTELPSIVTTADLSPVRPQLASRAGAAWNARGALTGRTPPTFVVGDYFGAGPPGAEVAVQETAADFATGNPHAHGYTILGLLAGTFAPGAVTNVAADQVTGMWPGPDVPLRVVDLRLNLGSSTLQDRLLQTIGALSGDVVVNTSLASPCALVGCMTADVEGGALKWIQRVRESELEDRFLHVSAAGNIYPNLQTDTAAARGSAVNAAALWPLPGVANLTNTIVVENTTASDPAGGPLKPLCLTSTSKRGGHISAIGNDIKSLAAPGVPRDLPAGGTSSATPQVAGTAAAVWALAPGLTPAQLAGILRTTARPLTTTSGDTRCVGIQAAPALDAYAALLAADSAATQPARAEILDAVDDGTFDSADLQAFRDAFVAGVGAIDYGRYDLNGDGRTGGGRDRFDLDASSPPAWTFSDRREVLGLEVLHDENDVRDLDVLCHEAHGPLYDQDDLVDRDLFAEQYCLPPVEIVVDPAFPGSLSPGQNATLRISAKRTDISDASASRQPGVYLDLQLASGTMGAASGTTGQDGAFSTTAGLGTSDEFEVEVIARAGPSGPELDRLTVQASAPGSGTVAVDQSTAEIRALSEACAGRDGEGCVVHTDSKSDSLSTLGTLSKSFGTSASRTGTDGFYQGNSGSATMDSVLNSNMNTTGAALEVIANGSAAGTAQRTFGAVESAHAAYSGRATIFARFRVIGDSVGYTAEGSAQATSTGIAGGAMFVLYRVTPFAFVQNVTDGPFDVSGTLAPGTYELGAEASCASDVPATCNASYSLTFRVQP